MVVQIVQISKMVGTTTSQWKEEATGKSVAFLFRYGVQLKFRRQSNEIHYEEIDHKLW